MFDMPGRRGLRPYDGPACAAALAVVSDARRAGNQADAALVTAAYAFYNERAEAPNGVEEPERAAFAELGLALKISTTQVRGLITAGSVLHRLPPLAAAFTAGDIELRAVKEIASRFFGGFENLFGPLIGPIITAATVMFHNEFLDEMDRLLADADPELFARLRNRQVAAARRIRSRRTRASMGAVTASLTAEETAEVIALIGERADGADPTDPRTPEETRVEAFLSLIRGQEDIPEAIIEVTDNDGTEEGIVSGHIRENEPEAGDPATAGGTEAEPGREAEAGGDKAAAGGLTPAALRKGIRHGTIPPALARVIPTRPGRKATVEVSADLATLLGLSANPGYLTGYGSIDPATTRNIASDAQWHVILTFADNAVTQLHRRLQEICGPGLVMDREELLRALTTLHAKENPAKNVAKQRRKDAAREQRWSSALEKLLGLPGSSMGPIEVYPIVNDDEVEPDTDPGNPYAAPARTEVDDPTAEAGPRPASWPLQRCAATAAPPFRRTTGGKPTGARRGPAIAGALAEPDDPPGGTPALDGHGGFGLPPAGALTYRPSAQVAALVRHLDGHCRYPGCAVTAERCELDHIVPFNHTNPETGAGRVTIGATASESAAHHRATVVVNTATPEELKAWARGTAATRTNPRLPDIIADFEPAILAPPKLGDTWLD